MFFLALCLVMRSDRSICQFFNHALINIIQQTQLTFGLEIETNHGHCSSRRTRLHECSVGFCLWTSLIYNMIFGVCNSSIFEDAVKLIASRKGTINWCVDVTPGWRSPKYDKGESPLCHCITPARRYGGFFYSKNSTLLSLLPG